METNKFGEIVLNEDDLCDLIMKGRDITAMERAVVDSGVDIERLASMIDNPGQLVTWTFPTNLEISVPEFDRVRCNHWLMPDEYKKMDVAEYVLGLCENQEQLQRCGQELLLFQEKDLFDLLRYLKYLVDIMHEHRLIWGVGRGSSVASYVLFKMGVHKIDSLYYDLDPREFLR